MRTKRFIYGLLIILSFLGLSSCQDGFDVPDITRPNKTELVKVNFSAPGLSVYQMKSATIFDPTDISTWSHIYNTGSYTFTLTGTGGPAIGMPPYTVNKTIAELKTGFSLTVMPGTYHITYTSEHTKLSDFQKWISTGLDIKIDAQNVVINATTPNIQLTPVADDYLIIFGFKADDKPSYNYMGVANCLIPDPSVAETSAQWYYNYSNFESSLTLEFELNGEAKTIAITSATKGKIYHIIRSSSGTISVLEPSLDYVPMVFPPL